MAQTITGKVENKGKNNDGRVFLNNTWYYATTKTKKYVNDLKLGDVATFNVDEKRNITFMNVEERGKPTTVKQPLQPKTQAELLNDKVARAQGFMQLSKKITDDIFKDDKKYQDSMGQHCNSIFIYLSK